MGFKPIKTYRVAKFLFFLDLYMLHQVRSTQKNLIEMLRRSSNKIKAVVLDFSGTTLDKYVLAPAVVFQKVFKKHGVDVSMAACRLPMGLRKDLHINKMLENPEVALAWQEVHGKMPAPEVEGAALFEDFVPMQLDVLDTYSELLPGVKDTFDKLRDMGIKIGGTTGFTREMVNVLEANANEQGIYFDTFVAGDDVLHGARPGPHMLYKNLDNMGIHNINEVIKVDDTVTGVGEGISANCFTVGVSRYSNYMNIDSLEQEDLISKDELEARHALSISILKESGADIVSNDITILPDVIRNLNEY